MLHSLLSQSYQIRCLRKPDDGAEGAGSGSDESNSEENTVAAGSAAAGAGKKSEEKMISQEIFNREAAKIRAQGKKETEALLQKFTEIQARLNLSEKEKEETALALEAIRTTGMTEKQKLEHQLQKIQDTTKAEIAKLSEDATSWQKRFEDQQLQTQIQSAVSANKGVDAEPFLALTKMWGTKITEIKIDDKNTGRYEARVMFPDTDKENKPIILDLTIDESVKRMSEIPKYKNMFNHGQTEGTGLRTDQFGDGKAGQMPDFSKLTPQQYEAFCKANPGLVGDK